MDAIDFVTIYPKLVERIESTVGYSAENSRKIAELKAINPHDLTIPDSWLPGGFPQALGIVFTLFLNA